jgi:hypothetical protein
MMSVVPSRSVEDPSVCFKQALRGWRRTIDPGCAAGRAVNGIRSGRSFAMSSGIASPCVIRDRPRALHVGGAGIVCVGPLGRPAASAGSRRAASASLRGSSVACLRAAGLIRWSNVKMRAKRPHGRAGESGGTRNREGCTATRLDPARWIYWRQRSATSRSWLCPSDRVANCRPSRPGTLCPRPTQQHPDARSAHPAASRSSSRTPTRFPATRHLRAPCHRPDRADAVGAAARTDQAVRVCAATSSSWCRRPSDVRVRVGATSATALTVGRRSSPKYGCTVGYRSAGRSAWRGLSREGRVPNLGLGGTAV